MVDLILKNAIIHLDHYPDARKLVDKYLDIRNNALSMLLKKYWTKTAEGYRHNDGYELIHLEDEGLLKLGGTWQLRYNGTLLAFHAYPAHFGEVRLFRWANVEITAYKRFKEIAP